jgi:hypothetical protein
MELENIILSEVSQFRRPKITCSPSCADYRPRTPKTIAVALLARSHAKGRPHREGSGKEGKLQLEHG